MATSFEGVAPASSPNRESTKQDEAAGTDVDTEEEIRTKVAIETYVVIGRSAEARKKEISAGIASAWQIRVTSPLGLGRARRRSKTKRKTRRSSRSLTPPEG